MQALRANRSGQEASLLQTMNSGLHIRRLDSFKNPDAQTTPHNHYTTISGVRQACYKASQWMPVRNQG